MLTRIQYVSGLVFDTEYLVCIHIVFIVHRNDTQVVLKNSFLQRNACVRLWNHTDISLRLLVLIWHKLDRN